jgi:branched-chain amino acid transport system substrate-binding protein
MHDAHWGRRKLLRAAGALVLAAGLAACTAPGGQGGAPAGGGSAAQGLPPTIKILSTRALTGPVSFAGINAQKGIDLAVEQVAEDGLLGASTLEIESKDVGASTQEAASAASQAIADPSYAAILGPEASAQAAAVSPIAQSSGMPVVYVQAGSAGVLVGDYTFRVTPPAQSYFGVVGDHLSQEGVRTASVLFNSGNPTLAELGQTVVPQLGAQHGFQVVGSAGVEVTAQDFTTAASQIAGQAPDVAFLMLTGPQSPVAITQLRQAGFTGEIVGMSAMGAGNLASAGQQAAGAVWPTNFTATQAAPSSQEFVRAYQAKYGGELPNNYAAEAYDAVWFLARGIAEANSADRAAVQQGLDAVAREGFAGAQGELTFDGHDARVPGVLVRWDGATEAVLADGTS